MRPRSIVFSVNLAVTMAASTVMAFVFGALGPLLREGLGISRTELGLLATAYLASGAVFSPLVGGAIDRLGSRRGLLVTAGYCVLGFVMVSTAPTYGWVVAAAAIAGVAGAMSNPLTNHVIAEHGGQGRRGLVLGVKQSGVQLGSFLCGATIPAIGVRYGWRAALLSAAAFPLVSYALTLASVPARPSGPVVRTAAGWTALVGIARERPFLVWIAFYALLMGGAMSATNVYLALYAFERLGYTVEVAGLIVATIGLIGIPARILWGRRVEFRTSGLANDLLIVAGVSVVSVLLIAVSAQSASALVWVAPLLLGGITSAWNVVVMMATIRDLPVGESARGTGLIQLGFYIGLLSGPFLFGLALGEHGSYTTAWLGVAAAFTLAALVVAVWRRLGALPQTGRANLASGVR